MKCKREKCKREKCKRDVAEVSSEEDKLGLLTSIQSFTFHFINDASRRPPAESVTVSSYSLHFSPPSLGGVLGSCAGGGLSLGGSVGDGTGSSAGG